MMIRVYLNFVRTLVQVESKLTDDKANYKREVMKLCFI